MAVLAPHFDLPFRFVKGSAAEVEQSSYEDVANCVEAIVRTPYGYRVYDNTTDFGIDPSVFEVHPVDIATIEDTILSQEPRAELILAQDVDFLDTLTSIIKVEVWDTSDSQ